MGIGAFKNASRSPTLLMDMSPTRSAVLNYSNLRSTESSGSKGALCSPTRNTERSNKGMRFNLWDLISLHLSGTWWSGCASLRIFHTMHHDAGRKADWWLGIYGGWLVRGTPINEQTKRWQAGVMPTRWVSCPSRGSAVQPVLKWSHI